MDMVSSRVHDYVVLKVTEDLSAKSDLSQLKDEIKKLVGKGHVNIALSFTQNSYLHTQTISTLVQCIETVRERGGVLGIVNPNDDIRDVLNTISLDKLVQIFPCEEALRDVPS